MRTAHFGLYFTQPKVLKSDLPITYAVIKQIVSTYGATNENTDNQDSNTDSTGTDAGTIIQTTSTGSGIPTQVPTDGTAGTKLGRGTGPDVPGRSDTTNVAPVQNTMSNSNEQYIR